MDLKKELAQLRKELKAKTAELQKLQNQVKTKEDVTPPSKEVLRRRKAIKTEVKKLGGKVFFPQKTGLAKWSRALREAYSSSPQSRGFGKIPEGVLKKARKIYKQNGQKSK
mmetsp:Transcript_100377/g.178399  ORF Transcript_100377/g.178399 Transcript_100377/m.178399 type:complete len:111 (-) Transcript_100377:89-421(-)|eukprot:CAMPEP_0197653532 /NCGR_PEP_ID=MMETSP1338-20131121/35941_1 /TAXON_ID=43686 ORGANISM="Pelagodinium beii, Strain RCC1491" /NCGR_SAMPLE_ID=MMETSP1338 /ASSEMBLY_ACC=CAM_ASM_000754 /LENGTH=110 /DNA_ID=CAMNT_0043228677 /DNA_START=85 /DNA_END=417 /DNA_ORIENTATION=+